MYIEAAVLRMWTIKCTDLAWFHKQKTGWQNVDFITRLQYFVQ